MELEIKVMWCKGLTAFNFFQKLTIYANVSITSEDQRMQLTQHQKQEQKTPVDEQGDGDPEWNHTITFDLRRLESLASTFENLSVVFELRHQGQLLGDKTVGDVHVPLRDLINSVGNDVGRFVSYQVRNPEGKDNGVLDFSYKVVRKDHLLENHPSNHDHNHNHSEVHISGYHHHHHHHQNHTSTQHGTSSDVQVSEYLHIQHDHYNYNYNLDQQSSSNPDRIQYPKIDLADWNANHSNLVGGNVNVTLDQNHIYPPPLSSSSVTGTSIRMYPPPPVIYPPPQQHQWGPPPPHPPHFPPPTAPPVVYPLPPNGDPHWGYNQPNNGYDGYRRW